MSMDNVEKRYSRIRYSIILSIIGILTSIVIFPSGILVQAQPATTTLTMASVTSSPITSLQTMDPNQWYGNTNLYIQGLTELPVFIVNVSAGPVIIPVLIENFTISPSNWVQLREAGKLEYYNITVQLNPNFHWANGQPVTAWDYVADQMLFVAAVHDYPQGEIPTFHVINNYTAVLTWPAYWISPATPLLSLETTMGLSGQAIASNYNLWKPIVDILQQQWPAIVNGTANITYLANKVYQFNPVQVYGLSAINASYNGPFYPVQVNPSEIVLAKNPYYPGANLIPWNQIIMYQFTSTEALISAVKAGEVDIFSPDPQILPYLPSYYKVISVETPYAQGIGFNLKNPWLNNILVRQAIAYVINRTAVAIAGGNLAFSPVDIPFVMPNTIPSWTPFYEWDVAHLNSYNTSWTKATQLLQEAGFTYKNGQWYTPNGTPFTLKVVDFMATSPSYVNMIETIVSELKAFGISVQFSMITSWPVAYQMQVSGNGYDLYFPIESGGYYGGEYDWGHGLVALEWDNISHFNFYATQLPNGSAYNLQLLYLETQTAPNVSIWIDANHEIGYVLNQFLPFLPLVYEHYLTAYNTQIVQAPPPNSWLWLEQWAYGWSPISFNFAAYSLDMIVPVGYTVTSTPVPVTQVTLAPATSTTTNTSTSTSTTTITTAPVSTISTTSTSSSMSSASSSISSSTTTSTVTYAIIGVIVVIIIAIIVAILMRRR